MSEVKYLYETRPLSSINSFKIKLFLFPGPEIEEILLYLGLENAKMGLRVLGSEIECVTQGRHI